MSRSFHFVSGLSAVALAALAACSPSGNDEAATSDEPAVVETGTGAEDTSPESSAEYRSRDELLAEFDEALELAQETNGDGSPAIWTMSDEDTTVHIFGTVHLMRPDLEWRTDEFTEKFNEADILVLELDMVSEEGQQAVARDFLSRGFYGDGRTLSNELPAPVLAAFESALAGLSLPVSAFDPMEPWMAAVNLSVLQLQSDGFDPNAGIEQILIADAEAAGKEFAFLETAADQAAIFDELPEDTQAAYLYETSITLGDTSRTLDQVVDEWRDGDVEGLGVLVANPDTGGGDSIYDALFVERNENWVPQIEGYLDDVKGTVFVAVGAGHLAGPDSVITLLRDKGHEIEGP
ncbi:TraB/GumN family protein [Henriciella marina]|uniref:TraB/GumN family protein n=1 Tax=Henriciella marina TaxID=453851 RepID=A0ABT4LSI4_9PROT|nr:TraB/GumN family protein [Henriciella marina]MCZ4297321.1 TraB/GumN family protein [Henriciella marina]